MFPRARLDSGIIMSAGSHKNIVGTVITYALVLPWFRNRILCVSATQVSLSSYIAVATIGAARRFSLLKLSITINKTKSYPVAIGTGRVSQRKWSWAGQPKGRKSECMMKRNEEDGANSVCAKIDCQNKNKEENKTGARTEQLLTQEVRVTTARRRSWISMEGARASGNSPDLYPGSARIESLRRRLPHRVCPQYHRGNGMVLLWLGHNCFLPNPLLLTSYPTTQ
jgi:hypothetical protein